MECQECHFTISLDRDFDMGSAQSNFPCCFICKRGEHLTETSSDVRYSSPSPKIYSWDARPRIQNHRIENQCDSEIIRQEGTINGEQTVIDNCKNCRIYLLDHQAALNIDDCEDCVIVSGPVSGSVFLRDSRNSTLCCVSGQLRLRDCSSIHLFCSSESEPIIENSEEIKISAYTLSYKNITDHFRAASLCPNKLISNSMYDFTPPVIDALSNWRCIQREVDAAKFIPPPSSQNSFDFSVDESHSYVPVPQPYDYDDTS